MKWKQSKSRSKNIEVAYIVTSHVCVLDSTFDIDYYEYLDSNV